MRTYLTILAAIVLLVGASLPVRAQIPAFPGAEGFGAYASGGRGGDVYVVTSLNNNGAGTLREALNTVPPEGRTVVFAVSGYIPVVSDTNFQVPSNVTIAGQTAPGDGVGLKGGRMLIAGNNTIMRHFRIRHGRNGTGGDCLNIASGVDVTMLDHISMMFSTDENFSFFGGYPDDFTMQYSSTSWGMERHNAGGLWDLEDGSCHHSLWAHHRTRNPKARPGGLLEWVNNVTFHWRNEAFIMGDSETPANWKANVQGCYYISIDDADDGSTVRSTSFNKATVSSAGIPNFSLYLANTLFDNNTNGIVDGSDLGYGIVSGSEFAPGDPVGANRYYKAATPFAGAPVPVAVDDPLTAYKKVVSSVGPLRMDANYAGPLRDELDSLLIDTVTNQYSILVQKDGKVAGEDPNRPNNGEQLLADQYGISNNGFGTLNNSAAPTDSDGDGMPDYWENALGWNALVQNHNSLMPSSGGYLSGLSFFPASTPAGYTHLEEYLHFKAIPHASIAADSVLVVDLRRYTDGFSESPAFTFSNVINGAAVLQPDGHTVHFTPATDFAGRCRFDFTVTDADGSTWTQTFGVLASFAFVPPASPSDLGAAPVSSSRIDLGWTDQSNNESGFRIERSNDGVVFSEIAVVAANTTSYSDEGLAPATTRYYRIRAFNDFSSSGYSSVASATTLTGAPAVPYGLSAASGNNAVTLSWNASPGASGYIVKRALTSGGPYTGISTNATASYIDSGVVNLTTYFYVVAAINVYGESANSSQTSTTPAVNIKINAGGVSVAPYEADGYYSGGGSYTSASSIDTSGVSDPAPDAVYTTEHNGDFAYTIPGLDAGKGYVVRLHFAEIYHTSSGSRTFNVLINGTQVLTELDVYAETGARYKALVRQFTAVANSSGEIEIEFDTVVDNAKVNGIEVLSAPDSPATLLPVADTHVRYGVDQYKNYGTNAALDTRQNDVAPRDYMAYIRFDLSAITHPISNATFRITKASGTLNNSRVRVMGLDDVAGNTAQQWGETSLTWDTLGSEIDVSIYPSPTAGESPLNFGRATDFEQGTAGITETVSGGSIVEVRGSALTSWLESRRLDGGLATLIVDFPVGASENSVNYNSREAANGQPTLTVTFPEPPVDETAPAAPSGLSATASGTQVMLDWADNSESDLTEYRVYRGTVSGGPYSLIASGVGDSTYSDTILVNSRIYYYVVTAIDYSLNESAYSTQASAMPVIPSQASLQAVADTHVRYGVDQYKNYGTSTTLDTRQNDTAPRDFMTYIRFDLSDIPDAITGATFLLTKSGGDALVNGRVRVLGLDNVSGNTPQNWSETGMTWDTLGSEIDTSIYPSPAGGTSPLNFGRVTDFEDGTAGISETISSGYSVLELSGSALVSWLENRRLDGGSATLIVDFPAGASDKSVIYNSREAASSQPLLSVAFDPSSPSAPSGLSATPAGGNVLLDWSNNGESDLLSYTVYRSTTEGSDYNVIASELGTSAYTDYAVENNITYYYVVTATDTSSNESDYSLQGEVLVTPDQDGDELSDTWEMEHFGNLSQTGTDDPDGDGDDNETEETNDTDPNVSSIPPEISISSDGSDLDLSWSSHHTGWRLMSRTNLLNGSWENISGSETTNVYEEGTAAGSAYYRLVYP